MFDFLQMRNNEQFEAIVEDKKWKTKGSFSLFIVLCLQLIMATLAIYLFKIEAHLGLPMLMPLIVVAFIINAIIPKSLRLSFFFFVSLIPIFYVFGVVQGALFMAIALSMIGICHLPITLNLRKAGIVLAGLLLAYAQYSLVQSGKIAGYNLSGQFLSLLGIMFMFRMIIYMYELKYEKGETSVWQRLTYFFMLPNICFPIFPIIDYKTFKSTYYNEEDLAIYQKGLSLIVLGILQLLMYRILYYITPQANNISGFWGLFYYLIISYLLLLRLNGILNLVVGLLRIFGFNLPDIFNYMFLAQGFDDYWRRLNIYWKDFIVKIFYYPIYFKFRKTNILLALVLGTIVTFIFNWALHAYQWFWILGTFSFRSTEMLFWGILGVFVLYAILKQNYTKKKPTVTQGDWSSAYLKSGSVLSTFFTLSVLYALYTSPTVAGWVQLLGEIREGTGQDWFHLISVIIIVLTLYAVLLKMNSNGYFSKIHNVFTNRFYILLLQFLFLGFTIFCTTPFIDNLIQQKYNYSIQSFIKHKLNNADQDRQSKGYYEEILLSNNFSSPLWQMENQKPKDWKHLIALGLKERSGVYETLLPNLDAKYKGTQIQTNRWGQRDKDYRKERPSNTIRIAIVGGSIEMGEGVRNSEIFEQIVEEKLNENFGSDSLNFEIINFAVSGSSIIKNIEKIRREVFQFEPQYLMFCVHSKEILHFQKTLRLLFEAKKIPKEIELFRKESPWLTDFENLLQDENIKYNPNDSREKRNLDGDKILEWVFSKIKNLSDKNKTTLLIADIPDIKFKNRYLYFEDIAVDLSIPFIIIDDVFQDYSKEELRIATWNGHPNALAHSLIADKLYLELVNYLELK